MKKSCQAYNKRGHDEEFDRADKAGSAVIAILPDLGTLFNLTGS
jgi:hypothetical protein